MSAGLNSKIWSKSGSIRPKIRTKLLAIAKKFLEDVVAPIKIKNIILTGSLCSYKWRPESDWDLHVIVEVKDDHFKETLLDYFLTKSSEFNLKHNIFIKGYKVEVNLKDEETEYSNKGIYDLIRNVWIIEPLLPHGLEIGSPEVLQGAHEYQNRIDDLIVSKGSSEDFKALRNDLKKLRQEGLKEGGEYSLGNLIFKTLRYSGHLQKISDYRSEVFDKEMSLEHYFGMSF